MMVKPRRTNNQDKKSLFTFYWRALYPHEIQPRGEYRFAKQALNRNWKFDWAFVAERVAVEVDGGNRMVRQTKTGQYIAVGAHTKPADYEKLNSAAALRWLVFRFTPEMLENDPYKCCKLVKQALEDSR